METNKLYRITNQSVIGGVAAGLAHHLGIDRALVRILFVLAFFFTAGVPTVMIYIVLWALLPAAIKESTDTNIIRI
ncbi:PspC domain-containing protein [Runella slithyformis]|uniref:PspC domain protein n=1 Tax=Runella slithyformis (strain ATCC 29530 / DSM 19594 / LMG 11500 / NCIMB 11436 / LSU 4) TaxID=761193 RepID=A0A7U3ZLC3_RUNSL|nr:PspC domain-containing protein [Runella slithyformis]AEI49296.1 PspC domain protein [Runella slithyformis DSM 19594]